MSKEKQIEFEMDEMLEIIENAREVYANDVTDHSENEYIREGLLNAGYRKQSEGEWIVCGMFDDFFKCSSCGDKHPWQTAIEYKFCPHCGAKMKGENK